MIVSVWVCLGGCCDNNPQPEVYKKMYLGTEFNLRKIVLTFKSPRKLTWRSWWSRWPFHRLLWSILNVFLPRKTKTTQKKGICSFLRHFTLIFYLPKVIKTIFPQVIFDVKFPALFKSAVENRGSHLRKGSYLHLTLKIDLKVKIDGTLKCPPSVLINICLNHFFVDKVFWKIFGIID